jgi:hypothetical protein
LKNGKLENERLEARITKAKAVVTLLVAENLTLH